MHESYARLALSVALIIVCASVPASSQTRSPEVGPSDGTQWTDLGRVEADTAIDDAVVSIPLRDSAAAELDRLLLAQQDPASGDYHRWLTPEEFGERFGATQEEVDAIVAALRTKGLRPNLLARSRSWIRLSGSARAFEEAFGAPIHRLQSDSGTRLRFEATTAAPGILSGVHILLPDDLRGHSHSHQVLPLNTLMDGSHGLVPGDWATIYDVNPIYQAGYRGADSSVTANIAVAGQSEIDLKDVQQFRNFFSLPANDPTFIDVGTSPGKTDDEFEGDLDVEWAGAIAPLAHINYYVASAVGTAAMQAVDDNNSSVLSVSYGNCESTQFLFADFWDTLWKQAASQSISVLVSSGDTGVSGCDAHSATVGTGADVNIFCTPNATCVGGTQFDDRVSPQTYWSPNNTAVTFASAISYIPEVAWNESGSVTGGTFLWSSGGGISALWARPSWQVAPGVPAVGFRCLPDIAATAAGHDYYFVVYHGKFNTTYGTSASTPSVAGVVALVRQRYGRLGNLNPMLYQLGNFQYSGGTTSVFHDVTQGTNTVPGVTGFSCGRGYDLVTGLGSLDANAFFAAVGTLGSCVAPSITAQPQPVTASGGKATVSVTAAGTPPLAYQWYVGPSGNTSIPIPNATSANQPLIGVTSTVTVWVQVRNACGFANSNGAVLTVTATPSPTRRRSVRH